MIIDNYGRRELYTDKTEISADNIIDVLREASIEHQINANKCNYLLNYEAGFQPLLRKKTYRDDIDVNVCDNIANEVTEFKLGYIWGNSITVTQRGTRDSGSAKESKAIALLNENYEADGYRKVVQTMARFIEICGVGYEFIDINADYEDGDSYFNIEALDPRYAFVVKSTQLGHKPVLGVTFREDKLGNKYYTCFTKDARYEVINLVKIIEKNENGVQEKEVDEWEPTANPTVNKLGEIPIVEWVRSTDRMGCFERQISEMDNLNLLVSDFTNDVDQNTQAIWHCNDIQFGVDESGTTQTPRTNDWLQTYTTRDGKTPFVTPLSIPYDYTGMLNNIVSRRALILQKCNVPQRNDNSGGSTGIAMSDATGWSSAEASACKEEAIISVCKMNEVRVVLKAIKNNPLVESGNPMLDLRPIDIVPSIKRQKTYEMTTKINALCTAIDHGVDYKTLFREITFFSDPQQAIEDSAETMERYLDKIFGSDKEEEINPQAPQNNGEVADIQNSADDPQNQIDNSPMLEGKDANQNKEE